MTIRQSPVAQLESDDSPPTPRATAAPTFAERLNRLFDTIKPPGRGYFSSRDLVNWLSANDLRISAPYVSQLRSGNRTRPSISTIEAIASFFRIDPAYFTDSEKYRLIERDLTVISAMRDPGVRRIAARVVGLPAHAIDEIVKAADELRDDEHPSQPS